MALPKQNKKNFILKLPCRQDREPERVYHKSVGSSSKLGICKFIAILLEVNEQLPLYRRMTDDRIRQIILNEFPGRKGLRRLLEKKITIGYYRTLYNTGRLVAPYGKVPEMQSNRWAEGGVLANRRTGRPVVEAEPSPDFLDALRSENDACLDKLQTGY